MASQTEVTLKYVVVLYGVVITERERKKLDKIIRKSSSVLGQSSGP